MDNSNGASVEMRLIKKDNTQRLPVALLRNSNMCMLTLLVSISSVMLSTGIAVGTLNPAMVILQKFFNETSKMKYDQSLNKEQQDFLLALTVSMMLAGGFVGALSIQVVLSLFSRKQSMIIMNLTNIIAILVLALGGRLIPSYEAVIIGRFIIGLFSGFGMNLIPIVVTELCVLVRQPFYLSLIGVNLSFGSLIGLLLGFSQALGTYKLWPVLLSISAVPSLLYLVLSWWLPESPSYLLRKGDRTEAWKTLCSLRENPKDEEIERDLSAMEALQQSSGDTTQISLTRMFTLKRYRRQLILVVMVFMQSQLCGINGIGMYTNLIFQDSKHFEPDQATIASTVIFTLQFFIALLGSIAVDRYGPLLLNIASSSVMGFSLIILTIVKASTSPEDTSAAYASVTTIAIYILAWAIGLNLTLFPMLGAFTTELTREAAYTFGGGIFWILSWFSSFIPIYLLTGLGDYAFLPWAILNLIFVVYIAIFAPTTKGKTPDEVQQFIQGGKTNLDKLRVCFKSADRSATSIA